MLSTEEREEIEELILDFFAFQVAACTTQDDCTCGRSVEEHRVLRGEA